MHSSRIIRVAMLVAFLSATGCWRRTPASIFGPRCDPPSTKEEVFVGLYSIYYREKHPTGRGPEGWPAAPLQTAARYLRCDPDQQRQRYRVRYAAIKLAAGLVIARRRFAPDRNLIDEFRGALDTLGIPELLPEEMDVPAAETPQQLEDKGGEVIDSKNQDDPLAVLQRDCCPCLAECRSGTATGGVGVVEFRISVNRDAQCLPHIADPQCWQYVTPLTFNDTHVVGGAECTSATPPVPTCRSTQTCNKPLLAAPAPLNMPPAPAAPWCGLLFEDVVVPASGITATDKNVLGIRTTNPPAVPNSYRMDYKLCEAREWSVTSPPQTGECALDVDCGYASVEDTGVSGNANLFGTKRLRFTPTFPNNANVWTPAALEVLATETATAACVDAQCPRVTLPGSCSSTVNGATPGVPKCSCDHAIDHCDGPFDSFVPAFDSPLCP